LYEAIVPLSIEAPETNRMEVEGTRGANIGLVIIGSTVGIEAFGSPCLLSDSTEGEREEENSVDFGQHTILA
jgi:hypothetical protein